VVVPACSTAAVGLIVHCATATRSIVGGSCVRGTLTEGCAQRCVAHPSVAPSLECALGTRQCVVFPATAVRAGVRDLFVATRNPCIVDVRDRL